MLNGDSTRGTLLLTDISGDKAVWADVLHDGPVPDVPPQEFRRIRAAHLATHIGESPDEIERGLVRWDAALDRFGNYDEVVFWFEHDLFDQLILIRHLHWLASIERGQTQFSLICVGEFPGISGFAGLGELSPDQLSTLFPRRQPVTQTQIDLGAHAWNLFRSPDPTSLVEWMDNEDFCALPFLDGALRRHLDDFPSTRNGLSRSENQVMRAVVDGHASAGALFIATQDMEEHVFMGDITLWSIVRRLAHAPTPLVILPPGFPGKWPVAITPAGQDVLSGRQDSIALNGIDRWMGGAHLTTERHWRWDGARLILVNSKLQTSNSKGRARSD